MTDTSHITEWSTAIQHVDLDRVGQLLHSQPELLWHPLVNVDQERDASPVIRQLQAYRHLGRSLGQLSAIPYTLLLYREERSQRTTEQASIASLLSLLLEHASPKELETHCWGDQNSTILHLVSFLGHEQIAQQMLDHGISADIPNSLGLLPADTALSDSMACLLARKPRSQASKLSKPGAAGTGRSETGVVDGVRPNYATPDRFKQLRQLAEKTDQKKLTSTRDAEGRYFKAGHVAETKRKVLSEEEAELEKQRALRRQEVALLAKRSPVKNNPLLKRLEPSLAKPAVTPQTLSVPTESASNIDTDSALTEETPEKKETKPKRNSKVISSLRNKSYVSTSVFRQAEPPVMPMKKDTTLVSRQEPSTVDPQHLATTDTDTLDPEKPSEGWTGNTDNSDADDTKYSAQIVIEDLSTPDAALQDNAMDREKEPLEHVSSLQFLSEPHLHLTSENDNLDRRRLSGSQKAQWSIAMTTWKDDLDPSETSEPTPSESDHDQWFECHKDKEEEDAKLATLSVNTQPSRFLDSPEHSPTSPPRMSIESKSPESLLDSPLSPPPSSHPNTLQTNASQVSVEEPDCDTVNYGSISVSHTSRYVRHYLKSSTPPPEPQKADIPSLLFQPQETRPKVTRPKRSQTEVQTTTRELLVTRKTSFQDLYTLPKNVPSRHGYGKLYLRINAANDLRLPLPKEPTYIRCVISDSRYEYMSGYELLSSQVMFAFECIIDTFPDMIVSVALHIKPDDHLRSKIPIPRLFTSSRNRKETLSDYIYPEDGSVGRTRFALLHMMRGCYKRPYAGSFDCFNAWSSRKLHSNEDTLKVIGALDVEMLYLPVPDPSTPVPRNLRDCDMALKLQSWNDTLKSTNNRSTPAMRTF